MFFVLFFLEATDSVHPDAEPRLQPVHRRRAVPPAAGGAWTDDRAARPRPVHRRSDLRRRQQPDPRHGAAQRPRDDVRQGAAP